MKKTCINDTEIYPNYLLIGFRDKATGKVWSVEAFGPDERLSKEDRNWLREFMRRNRIIGFNLNGFDLLIIYGAIAGLTVRELRELRDDISTLR